MTLPVEELVRLGALRFQVRRLVDALEHGLHPARGNRGGGDFLEHRPYASGDAPKAIDWRASARHDAVVVRDLRAERRLNVCVLLDSSASMGFGDPVSKFRYASWLGLGAAFAAARSADGATLNLDAGALRWSGKLRRGMAELGRWSEQIETLEAAGQTDLTAAVERAVGEGSGRGLLIVVSDLLEVDDSLWRRLGDLRHAGWHIAALRVLTPEELEFPFSGATQFIPVEQGEQLEVDAGALRRAYLDELERFESAQRRACAAAGVHWISVRTDASPVGPLRRLMAERLP
jgi:uncharacterized protein (DUF58 family)